MGRKTEDTYRPDERTAWEHLNAARVKQGLPPYRPRLQEEKVVERAPTPMPDEPEQEMLTGESQTWNPCTVTPAEGTDIDGKKT
jgi:hypothetical protein